jgi:hypothetical protein
MISTHVLRALLRLVLSALSSTAAMSGHSSIAVLHHSDSTCRNVLVLRRLRRAYSRPRSGVFSWTPLRTRYGNVHAGIPTDKNRSEGLDESILRSRFATRNDIAKHRPRCEIVMKTARFLEASKLVATRLTPAATPDHLRPVPYRNGRGFNVSARGPDHHGGGQPCRRSCRWSAAKWRWADRSSMRPSSKRANRA